jgi:hypothetical protein
MNEHKVISITSTPNTKHQWVFSERKQYFININRCTETGDVQLISNLPLSDDQVKSLADVK